MDLRQFFRSFLVLLLVSAATDDLWACSTPEPWFEILASANNDFLPIVSLIRRKDSLGLSPRVPRPDGYLSNDSERPRSLFALGRKPGTNTSFLRRSGLLYLLLSLRR